MDLTNIIQVKTYTNTPEGKYVLDILNGIISTRDMEVYKCDHCEELYGSTPKEALYDDKPTCGLCQDNLKRANRDAYGLENVEDDYNEE